MCSHRNALYYADPLVRPGRTKLKQDFTTFSGMYFTDQVFITALPYNNVQTFFLFLLSYCKRTDGSVLLDSGDWSVPEVRTQFIAPHPKFPPNCKNTEYVTGGDRPITFQIPGDPTVCVRTMQGVYISIIVSSIGFGIGAE